MHTLFDNQNHPTTLQAGDVMVCELENPLVSITRNPDYLFFGHVGNPGVQDNKMLLDMIPTVSAYQSVAGLIAAATGLEVEKPVISNRTITFTFVTRA